MHKYSIFSNVNDSSILSSPAPQKALKVSHLRHFKAFLFPFMTTFMTTYLCTFQFYFYKHLVTHDKIYCYNFFHNKSQAIMPGLYPLCPYYIDNDVDTQFLRNKKRGANAPQTECFLSEIA